MDSDRSSTGGKLIAIVEDDALLTTLFQDVLGYQCPWHLQFFTDGQLAKDQLPTLGADLILLDVGLPNLDGVSLYKYLRGHSDTRHIPIIVITGSRDWELHRMGLNTGLFLRKPFKVRELLVMIKALFGEEAGELPGGET